MDFAPFSRSVDAAGKYIDNPRFFVYPPFRLGRVDNEGKNPFVGEMS
jgi:hypothetical protein